jgi:hypothetical protein
MAYILVDRPSRRNSSVDLGQGLEDPLLSPGTEAQRVSRDHQRQLAGAGVLALPVLGRRVGDLEEELEAVTVRTTRPPADAATVIQSGSMLLRGEGRKAAERRGGMAGAVLLRPGVREA